MNVGIYEHQQGGFRTYQQLQYGVVLDRILWFSWYDWLIVYDSRWSIRTPTSPFPRHDGMFRMTMVSGRWRGTYFMFMLGSGWVGSAGGNHTTIDNTSNTNQLVCLARSIRTHEACSSLFHVYVLMFCVYGRVVDHFCHCRENLASRFPLELPFFSYLPNTRYSSNRSGTSHGWKVLSSPSRKVKIVTFVKWCDTMVKKEYG